MSVIVGAVAGARRRLAPADLPDLVITGVEWSTDDGGIWGVGSVTEGSNVWFRATIENVGGGATPGGVIHGIAFKTAGVTRSWSDDNTTSLAASASRVQAANSGPASDGSNKTWDNAPAGTHALDAIVDDVNRIVESDETNNTFATSITVTAVGGSGELAIQADLFVDSVAVATHFNRSDYQTRFSTLSQQLADAKIRHIRDSVLCFQTANVTYVNQLWTNHGIKGIYTTNLSGDNWPATAYNNILTRATGGFAQVSGLLGMNEPYVNSRTPAEAWDVQINLWNTFRVNGSAAAQAIPIWPCSPTSPAEADDHKAYGLTQTTNGWIDRADGGHTHPYPTGQHPDFGQVAPYPFGSLFYNMEQVGEKVGGIGRQQIVTETGYRYAPSTHPNIIPEDVGGIYVPRLYLFYFWFGLPSGSKNVKAALYQLLDDSEHFKLINTNGTTTPAYNGLKNLMIQLEDPGVLFTPGALDYTLSGSLTDLHRILFQKRTGVFYLVMWLAKSGYNQSTDQRITVTPQSVTVTFNVGQFDVDRNVPNDNLTWASLGTNLSSVNTSVGEKVQILRITP